jgi:type I restriction enzyme S subunit
MRDDWKQESLEDLISIKHGYAFKGEFFTDEKTISLLVTPGNFSTSGQFQNTKPKYYKGPIPEDYILATGDLLVTMTDLSKKADTLGYGATVPNDENIWLHNQRIGLINILDDTKLSKYFLSYLFKSPKYRHFIVSSATGTTVKHTSPKRILKFEFKLPPLTDQKAIAHILGTLDDKIELNRKMNETLEEMAQALFKSWFVDFDPVLDKALTAGHEIPEPLQANAEKRKALGDKRKVLPQEIADLFPDRFVFIEELGWVPEGWEVKSIKELSVKISKGTTPRKSDTQGLQENTPFIKVRDIDDKGDISYDLDLIPKEIHLNQLKRSKLEVGDILFSIAGTIGRVAILPDRLNGSNCNQAVAFIRLKELNKHLHFVYLNLRSERIQFEINSNIVQAVQANASLKNINELIVLLPIDKILSLFNNMIGSIFRNISNNKDEIHNLSKTRDTLLPKLISGELRVPNSLQL